MSNTNDWFAMTDEERREMWQHALDQIPNRSNWIDLPSEDNPPCPCLDPDWYNYTVERCDACEELVESGHEEELDTDCGSNCKCKQPSSPGSKYDTRGRLLQ